MRAASARWVVTLTLALASACSQSSQGTATATTSSSASSSGAGGGDPCADHCHDGALDCGEVGFDCGGDCAPCGPFVVANVCGPAVPSPWQSPHRVAVVSPDGMPYADDVEEPEVRDYGGARWLFFNNAPKSGDKDLFYARWDDAKKAFVVLGLLPGMGAQTPAVDGNPSLDENGNFYFISTRSYPNPTESIHRAKLTIAGSPPTASLSGITRLDGLSRTDVPWVTQGVQVTWDGAWLYFDEAKFGQGFPTQSDIILAKKQGSAFARLGDAELARLLGNVNTQAFLEYAESISRDGLELYFTRTWVDAAHLDQVVMCVMRSTRKDPSAPFGPAENVAATEPAPGVLMEAPSLSPDEKTLYYHRIEPGDSHARLYAVERP